MKKIVFPEGNNPYIQTAIKKFPLTNAVSLNGGKEALEIASEMLANSEVDAMIAGIDYTSRDVILTVRDKIGMLAGGKLFSSLFVCDLPDGERLIVSDGASCKHPNTEQLAEIIHLNYLAAKKLLPEEPRIAVLSFSTFGSGGKDESITRSREAIKLVRERWPEIKVDGEMQLDAAIVERVGAKKGAGSEVAGQANVLITPDIITGNILYKAIEWIGKARVAGPILLGFKKPVSDLSRGSSVEDILLSIDCILKLCADENKTSNQ